VAARPIMELMHQQPLVVVVDDDDSIRESLPNLLEMLGFTARSFASAEDFLASEVVTETGCLILDVSMPGLSGPDLQLELKSRGLKTPIVFITARYDPNLRRELLARGAIECLFKPFSENDLRSALDRAVAIRR
jgi:FixJ family two-component response regulator